MDFDLYIGIDYSGAETPDSLLRGLQVFAAAAGQEPQAIRNPADAQAHRGIWSRRAVAQWLLAQVASGQRLLVGIDHGFSFPKSYLDRHQLRTWPEFLDHFQQRCTSGMADACVDRNGPPQALPIGRSDELRLCERWTCWAKGAFQFDVQGSNAMSTHAGIPWLRHLRGQAQDRIHIWPFDGWQLPERESSVIAEVCSPMLRERYPRADRTADEQDAYAAARWLAETAGRGVLERYLNPPLTHAERQVAALEGWILGVG